MQLVIEASAEFDVEICLAGIDGAGEASVARCRLSSKLDFGGDGSSADTERHRFQVEVGGVEHEMVDRLGNLD